MGPQRLPALSHDVESPAQPQFWESIVQLNNTSQFSPPVLALAQSTSSGLEQSPGTAQLSGAQEAEPHRHRSAASGKQYPSRCQWENCVTVTNFKRPQELERHIREVHGSESPRKCPFCPPDRRPWKRPYLLRDHLIADHRAKFGEDDIKRILVLKGKRVFEFVDAIKPTHL